jgi:ZIP family zinc transporter
MWLYSLIPSVVAAAGAVFAAFKRPSDKIIGAIQHLAVGVVFYAGAGELLPDAKGNGSVWPLVVGGGIGIAVMLLLQRHAESARKPTGLIIASSIDALIDGLTLGLAFELGRRHGTLLVIALAAEFLFLGFSIAAAFGRNTSRRAIVAWTTGVALMVPVGAWLASAMRGLDPFYRSAAFAFGLIALLYLVTEGLLVEAHEKPETMWGAALLFGGFLALAVFDQMLGK